MATRTSAAILPTRDRHYARPSQDDRSRRPVARLDPPHPMILKLAGLLARIEYAEAQFQSPAARERA
jgi:hypothetical protein